MTIFYKFQDVFSDLLNAPDRETRDETIKFEQMMTADFIGTLNNIKNANTREEGDAILTIDLNGTHIRTRLPVRREIRLSKDVCRKGSHFIFVCDISITQSVSF